MGLLDKVKAQAEQVAAKAQQGVNQGQAKLDAMQAKKAGDALLRDLGAAYYSQQRSGGSQGAVTDLVARVDAHIAEHGSLDAPAAAPATAAPPTPSSAPAAPTVPTQQSADPAEGSGASYGLEDL
jgi:hypothetical protein